MTNDPIFIIGTERSGSNLLRLLLNSHPRIVVPHPPHVMRYFAPLEAQYGDLRKVANRRRLAADVRRLVRVHIYPWETVIDLDSLVADADPPDLFGIFVALYEQARRASGKPRWGCKSTFMIDHVDRVGAHFPEARLLYLVRDPRDVAVSSKGAVFNPYHPFFTAELWRRQQETGLALRERLDGRQLLLVTYERLVADPTASLKRICAFLDEPFDPAMLRFFTTSEAKKSGRLSTSWANTDRPVLTNRIGTYRRGLSEHELRLVEAICHAPMRALGYQPEHDEEALAATDLTARRYQYQLTDHLLEFKAELGSLRRDRNHWRRWAREGLMLGLRLRRSLAAERRWRLGQAERHG